MTTRAQHRARHHRTFALGVIVAVTMALTTAACSPDLRARGNNPPEERLTQIEPGKQTRQQVTALLGSPSATSTFDDETWYYISAQTRQYAVFKREELERRIIAISFDTDGTVKSVRELNLDDGRDIAMLDRETPTMGNEITILEQLMGNLGRFDQQRTTTIDGF